ncbi:MAG: four helix bundle suffix domain-containing protein, partial [Bacteroidales bacterium]|nr:four helix bundle suffix domain-containing protein [Candidatus Sodaliphilus fimicaballi]
LCFQVDAMLNRYLNNLEKRFVTEGGIKERMHAARTGYRKEQDEKMTSLVKENSQLKQQLAALQAAYDDLKQRALKAYNEQKTRIEELENKLED